MEREQFPEQKIDAKNSLYQKIFLALVIAIIVFVLYIILQTLLTDTPILEEPQSTANPAPLSEEAMAQARLDLPVSLPASGTSSVSIVDSSADIIEYEPTSTEQSVTPENQTTPTNLTESEPTDEPEINDPAITVNNVSVTSNAKSQTLTNIFATVITVDNENGILMASDGHTTWRVIFSDSTTFTINTSVIAASSVKPRDTISIAGKQMTGSDEIVAETISITGVRERAVPVY